MSDCSKFAALEIPVLTVLGVDVPNNSVSTQQILGHSNFTNFAFQGQEVGKKMRCLRKP